MKFNIYSFSALWRYHPAVLYAFAVLLGSSAALHLIPPFFALMLFSPLLIPLFKRQYEPLQFRLLLAIAISFISFATTSYRYEFPKDEFSNSGIATFEISSIKAAKTAFGPRWNYKGILKSFINEQGEMVAQEIPVTIILASKENASRPTADFLYVLKAHLKLTPQGKYLLKPIKNEDWHPLEKIFNFAEWRFWAKSQMQKFIQESIQNPHVGSFLSGIATGEFNDRILSYELSRFGLQHLMAISGLHFSILSTLLALMLGILFSRKTTAIITMCLMSAYFFFLGASPSVTRAWIAILIAFTSCLIQKRYSSFNALGVAALIVILLDPLTIQEIGFQFSFGVTAAILLWFPLCEIFLQKLFRKRTLGEVTMMDNWDQYGYCTLYFFRQSLALCVAVNLVALPLTLYHFQAFPLMSLVYNLFFPFLVSFSLILLTFSTLFSFVFPWFAQLLLFLNEHYTQFVLNFALGLPKTFDVTLHVETFSKELLIVYLLALFGLGITYNYRFVKNQLEEGMIV